MEFAKINSRGEITIPKSIRESANLAEGDVIAFEIEGDHLLAYKVISGRDDCLAGFSRGLSEWNSPEDEEAWREL